MAIKPILFNTEMVRGIQAGIKTVTRRPIKNMDIINGWDCEEDGTPIAFVDQATGDFFPPTMPCFYQPGDILYVRETWAEGADGYVYKADNPSSDGWGWCPSIHMPRAAARIFLRVTGVRVERLWDITEEQAKAEGFYKGWATTKTASMSSTAKQAFMWTWDSTIKRADQVRYGWGTNPWVWVIEFELCEKPEETTK